VSILAVVERRRERVKPSQEEKKEVTQGALHSVGVTGGEAVDIRPKNQSNKGKNGRA